MLDTSCSMDATWRFPRYVSMGGRKLDFVDCVLAAEASVNGRDVLTFDKKLKKLIASMGG